MQIPQRCIYRVAHIHAHVHAFRTDRDISKVAEAHEARQFVTITLVIHHFCRRSVLRRSHTDNEVVDVEFVLVVDVDTRCADLYKSKITKTIESLHTVR